jgi:hypothetical protein
VEPNLREKATDDWKERAEESVASYIRNNCEEGVLVRVLRGADSESPIAGEMTPGHGSCSADSGEQIPASLISGCSAPEPAQAAGGVTASGGGGAAMSGRVGPAASGKARFFSVTITVKPAERCHGDRGSWIDNITETVKEHVLRVPYQTIA